MKKVFASLVNVLKSAPKSIMGMLMLSSITFFASCTEESVTYHATAATDIMVDSTMTSGYGWAQTIVAASAKDADNNTLTANGNLRYQGLAKVYVDQLGMPVTLEGTTDGTTFKTTDGNVFTRTESHSGDITVAVAGGTWGGGYLGERLNDSTEVAFATFTDEVDVYAGKLPEGKQRNWKGTVTSVVPYLRVVKPVVVPDVVEWRMRAEADEVVDGDSYYTVYAEKLVNGTVNKTYKTYLAGISFGTWRPNVSAQVVTSTTFTVKDSTDELPTDEPRHNLGTEKAFSVVNTSKVEYHFDVRFAAPKDAEGKTERTIAGHINVWSNSVIFHNPETGEDMHYDFVGTAETTNHEVTDANLYTRTVVIKCNGEVVDTQVGTVQLTVVQ